MTVDEIRTILTKIDNMRDNIADIKADIKVLKVQNHTPEDCPLVDRIKGNEIEIKNLSLSEARKQGIMATIGVIAGLMASLFTIVITRIWR